jgi:hypothetical protein
MKMETGRKSSINSMLHETAHSSAAPCRQPLTSPVSAPRQRLVNSTVITGTEFHKYCTKHGLCYNCGLYQTHEPKKGVFKTQIKPITKQERNGEYTVYKGYCIQPTCYTLGKAKILAEEDGAEEDRRASLLSQKQKSSRFSLRNVFSSRHLNQDTPDVLEATTTAPLVPSKMDIPPRRSAPKFTLDLSNQTFTNDEIINIVKTRLQGIKTLILDRCQLGGEGIGVLVDALLDFPPETLKVLCLRGNNIGLDGSGALAQLVGSTGSLKKLHLSHNNLGDDGVVPIFRAMQYSKCSTLEELVLSSNKISFDGAIAISQSLMENASLVSLGLDNNELGDPSVEEICRGIQAGSRTRLRILNLRHNHIRDEGAEALAKILEKSSSIRIKVDGNEIGNDGAAALLAGLVSSCKKRTSIEGVETNQVTDLSLLDQIAVLNRSILSHVNDTMTEEKQGEGASKGFPRSKPSPPGVRREPTPRLLQHTADERYSPLDQSPIRPRLTACPFQSPTLTEVTTTSSNSQFSTPNRPPFAARTRHGSLDSFDSLDDTSFGMLNDSFDNLDGSTGSLVSHLGTEISAELVQMFPDSQDLEAFLRVDSPADDDDEKLPGAFNSSSSTLDIPDMAELKKLFNNQDELRQFLEANE